MSPASAGACARARLRGSGPSPLATLQGHWLRGVISTSTCALAQALRRNIVVLNVL